MSALVMPKELTTARLRLTAWRVDHFEPLVVHNADPDSTRYTGGVMTRDECWKALAMLIGHWTLRGYGMYAVEDTTGALVGGIGLYRPEGWPELEVGYDLVTAARGKGFATEAAAAVRDEAAARGVTRLASFIHVDNAPSIRVAERLGATRDELITLNDAPCWRYLHAMDTPTHHPIN
ncbi:MAG: GNAT family N-acetyltransferase [Pseudomonadota bacterium]